MNAAYGTVDVTDDRQVREYERHFYRAYARLADNKLVRLIWEWTTRSTGSGRRSPMPIR